MTGCGLRGEAAAGPVRMPAPTCPAHGSCHRLAGEIAALAEAERRDGAPPRPAFDLLRARLDALQVAVARAPLAGGG